MLVSPTGRIVVLGATGYTGDLAVRSLVAAGARPVLAGRNPARLEALAGELGGLEHAVADVDRPQSVRALVGRGDVLLSTVGPFARWGRPAVDAAVDAGAHYLDSTGEGPFIRQVFEHDGPRALAAGSGLLPAFGYDYVPGNLAGALALRRAQAAGAEPASVDVGYFLTGPVAGAMSGGTRASVAGVMFGRGYAWRGGRLVDARPGTGVVRLLAGGRIQSGVTVSASEQLALPRLAPGLSDVRVGLGWFGPAALPISLASRTSFLLDLVPPLNSLVGAIASRLGGSGSSGGPNAELRSRTGSLVVAQVRDGAGRPVSRVELVGPNGYTLTGDLLAWGARAAAAGGLQAAGALGPVDAFGLDVLVSACASLGLTEVPAS